MNLLNILKQHTAHINLHEVEFNDKFEGETLDNLSELLDKHNIELTRELDQTEMEILSSLSFVVPKTAEHIELLKNETITPEMLYAILDYLRLRQGEATVMKFNSYFRRTMTLDALILATLYHLTNQTYMDLRKFNSIMIARNILDMPIDVIVNHILNDNLIETVDNEIVGKNYKSMSNTMIVKHLLKYIYNIELTRSQYVGLNYADYAKLHLLALIVNNEITNIENLDDVLSHNSLKITHLKPLYDAA